MKKKRFTIGENPKMTLTFLQYEDKWVFPIFSTYVTTGVGAPVAMLLYYYDTQSKAFEHYKDVTVNLPGCEREAGCQFIDTNNCGSNILEWLEDNKFGTRTGKSGQSGFCTYPEFDFYEGGNFWRYRKICEKLV